jgi:hypothetical protein
MFERNMGTICNNSLFFVYLFIYCIFVTKHVYLIMHSFIHRILLIVILDYLFVLPILSVSVFRLNAL